MMENFSMMDFNYFDVTIAAIVLILGIKGFLQGFIKEVFGLVGLVAGVFFASRYASDAAAFITANFLQIENESLLKLVGFLFILIIIWLSATILGSIFSKLTNQSGLGFLNRLFGFVAGGGKYFLIFALIVTALSNVSLVKDNLEKHVEDSILYPYLKKAGSYLINLDPSTLGLTSTSTTQVVKEVINLNEDNTTGDWNYALYANASNSSPGTGGYWAGYFNGNTNVNGSIYQNGTVLHSKSVAPLLNASEKVMTFKPVSIINDNNETSYAFDAEAMKDSAPELVREVTSPPDPKDKNSEAVTSTSVNISAMLPVLTKALQELNEKVENLEKENNALKAEINKLKANK